MSDTDRPETEQRDTDRDLLDDPPTLTEDIPGAPAVPSFPEDHEPSTAEILEAINAASHSIHMAFEGLKKLVTRALQNQANNAQEFRKSVERDVGALRQRVEELEVHVRALEEKRAE